MSLPTIETDNLRLRPFSLSDSKAVQRLAGDKDVSDMTATIPYPYEDGVAESWIETHSSAWEKKEILTLAIESRNNSELLGCMTLIFNLKHKRAEIAYWVGKPFWGQGVCTEAGIAIIDWGFKNLDLEKITSHHMSINPASGRVMQKMGMTQEGVLRDHFHHRGNVHDMVVYGLLKEEFKN